MFFAIQNSIESFRHIPTLCSSKQQLFSPPVRIPGRYRRRGPGRQSLPAGARLFAAEIVPQDAVLYRFARSGIGLGLDGA